MSLISVQNLTFGYAGSYTDVFENASFTLDTDWKLGLVGRNGRGKTTLLKLLCGRYEYSGRITAGVKFQYFPFEVKEGERLAMEILCEICPAEEWEILREASLLEVEPEKLYTPFSRLSSGEQTKLLLAALFLTDDGFLLIDEPTNHLDAAARRTVSAYLNGKKGFILVSHDRSFLDGCVDHILSINRKTIEVQSGNFSVWLENFERRQALEAAQSEQLKKDIARLNSVARRTAEWADKAETSKYGKASSGLKQDKGYVGHKAAKVMKRAKVTEDRARAAAERKSELLGNAETSERLKLFPQEYHSQRLLSISQVSVSFGGRVVLDGLSFEVLKGERIALDGKNGCGKSTVLKLLAGGEIAHTGEVNLPSGLKISYIPQTAEVKGKLSDFAKEREIDEGLFKAVLNKMGFVRSDMDGDVANMSEGQKKKVLIAASLCARAHLYIWDEPLNYIDIYTRIQIENLLLEFKPTMVFVEHDASFRNAVATRVIKL